MEITPLSNDILLSAGAIVLVTNITTSIVKNWIKPRFGDTGVQALAFAVSLIGAALVLYKDQIPGLWELLQSAGVLFSLAVAFYEVILKHFGSFKRPTEEA